MAKVREKFKSGVGPAIFTLCMLRNCVAGKINKRRRASPYCDVFRNASDRVLFRDHWTPHGNTMTLLAFADLPSQESHPLEGLSLRTSITYALRLPGIQVYLSLGPINCAFRSAGFILVKQRRSTTAKNLNTFRRFTSHGYREIECIPI